MKTLSCAALLVLTFTSAFTQTSFEEGYFIDIEGRRTDCLINNGNWTYNPREIEFKLREKGEVRLFDARTVQGFGIGSTTKYVSSTVNIDRSPDEFSSMTRSQAPEFSEETLFLRVLIEGKANLYEYQDPSTRRFFYSVDGSPIEQLVYKRYLDNNNVINQNIRFRQQLWNSLSCSSIDRSVVEKIKYSRNALIRIFSDYNSCGSGEFNQFNKGEGSRFNIALRPRLNFSSLTVKNSKNKNMTSTGDPRQDLVLALSSSFSWT